MEKKQLSKQIKLVGVMLLVFTSFSWAKPKIYQTSYSPEQCVQGTSGRWTGACSCYDGKKTAGRYCDQPVGGLCDTNSQCQADEFCFYPPKESSGICHKISHYPVLTKGWLLWKKSYLLSGELMNWQSTQSFCEAVGGRNVTRADFGCDSMGVACLDLNLLVSIRAINGLGFFWLDGNEQQNDLAYYADFNDGIVYSFKKSSAAVTQALCVLGKTK